MLSLFIPYRPMSPSPVITNSPPAVQVPPLPPSYHSSPPHLTSPTEMSPSDEVKTIITF